MSYVETNVKIINQETPTTASVQAIQAKSQKTRNPWVLSHGLFRALAEAGDGIIKEQQKREKETRDAWKIVNQEKADLYPEMASHQERWKKALLFGACAILGTPFAGEGLTKFLPAYQDNIRALATQIPNLLSSIGIPLVQTGKEISSLKDKAPETVTDKEIQDLRQQLEMLIQDLTQARQDQQTLSQHHIELLRALTQILAR